MSPKIPGSEATPPSAAHDPVTSRKPAAAHKPTQASAAPAHDSLTRAPEGRAVSSAAPTPSTVQAALQAPGEAPRGVAVPHLTATDGGKSEPILWPRRQDLVLELQTAQGGAYRWRVSGGDLPQPKVDEMVMAPDRRHLDIFALTENFDAGKHVTVFRWPSKGHPKAGETRSVTVVCSRSRGGASVHDIRETTYVIKFV